MNINPISFGRTIKIVGSDAKRCAERIASSVEHPNKDEGYSTAERLIRSTLQQDGETSDIKYISRGGWLPKYKIAKDSKRTPDNAQCVHYKNSSYVVSGKEYYKLQEYYDDMALQVRAANERYGETSPVARAVKDSELDRYLYRERCLVEDTCSREFVAQYDEKEDCIKKFSIIV